GKLFAKPSDHFGDQLVEIERFEVQFEPARSNSRDVEQSFDQHMQAVQVKSRFVEEFANARNLARPAMQELEAQVENVERVSQFVGRDGDEFIARLHGF